MLSGHVDAEQVVVERMASGLLAAELAVELVELAVELTVELAMELPVELPECLADLVNHPCDRYVYEENLRARDSDAAIAGGVNLIMTVDQHMNTAKLGILSPTSTCHTFDAAPDGYVHLLLRRPASVVRKAYEASGLTPRNTAYAELHGTGTPVDDPIETRAMTNALNDDQS